MGTWVNFRVGSATSNVNGRVLCASIVDMKVMTLSNQVRGVNTLSPAAARALPK
jgi:hypothetical protein